MGKQRKSEYFVTKTTDEIGDIEEVFDKNSRSLNEVESEFPFKYHITDEKAVSLDNNYILKICGTSNKVGIAVSDFSCEIYSYDETGLRRSNKFVGHDKNVCDIKFSPKNNHLLFTGSADGTIKLWDDRAGDKHVAIFEENTDTKQLTKPLTCFDVSCEERVVCGGTELVEGDAYLMFWDVRARGLLGAYWNSHTDDVTQVAFSPQSPERLLSGGVDGLVNMFDISELCEEDALLCCVCVECDVQVLRWAGAGLAACSTNNQDLQLWDVAEASRLYSYSREQLTQTMMRTSSDDCYVIDIFSTSDDQINVLTGSYSDRGECLRTLQVQEDGLHPMAYFSGNKQIVRCSWYDKQNNNIITGGESGILSLWEGKYSDGNTSSPRKKGKITSAMEKLNIRKRKPY